MKAHSEIIPILNIVLKNELTAINQYFLHARMFKNWGFEVLNEYEYKQSIRVMREADRLIERILFLEGLPNLQSLGALGIGENVQECLNSDMKYEVDIARETLLSAISKAENILDFVTRDLLEDLLAASEQSIDWYETQCSLIEDVGLPNYLQSQIHDA
jgi:bacterioferritin